jgi:hypothetical protein
MARGKTASPNLTCISLQLIRRQQHHIACSPAKVPLPHMEPSRGEGVPRCAMLPLPSRHQGIYVHMYVRQDQALQLQVSAFRIIFLPSYGASAARSLSLVLVVYGRSFGISDR